MPLEIVGGSSGSGGGGSSAFDPTTTCRVYEDYLSVAVFTPFNSGAGAAQAQNAGQLTPDRPGQLRQLTGTTATGVCNSYCIQPIEHGKGFTYKSALLLLQLSTGSEEFETITGLVADVVAGRSTNGIYFLYDRAVLGANWHCVTDDDTGTTTTDSGVAADTAFNDFEIVMSAGYDSCVFSINGAVVATHTTVANFPDVNDRGYPQTKIQKSVGTTGVFQYIDYQLLDYTVDR